MTKFLLSLLSLVLLTCNPSTTEVVKQQQPTPTQRRAFDATGKTATVYTTAENTDLRLTQTGQQPFQPAAQPLETEIAVFVNPNKTFQSFMGIGGAITDASAEVFAALPPPRSKKRC